MAELPTINKIMDSYIAFINAHYVSDEDARRIKDEFDRLRAENAKLRELGGEVASILFNLDVDRCGLCQRDSISHPCPVHTVKGGECLIKSELRELGAIKRKEQ